MSANEIRTVHVCGHEQSYSTQASASCPCFDWAGFKQIYRLRWETEGFSVQT